jgi:short-subunit dehydrogenase
MKTVVITGATSGIGRATAAVFKEKGYQVYGIARRVGTDEGIKYLTADVTSFESLEAVFKQISEEVPTIDILINNAGMGISGSVENTTTEDAHYIFNVNVFGVFNAMKAVIPYMRAQGHGKIINISSVAGKLSIPFQAFYSATKAAVNKLTEAIRIEVKPFNIQVMNIMPGDVKTDFTKNRRKNVQNEEYYGTRIEKSLEVMEKDEQNGMPSSYVGKVIYRVSQKRRLPLYKTIGFKYKIFVGLSKLLPSRFVNNVVGSIYGFTKEK